MNEYTVLLSIICKMKKRKNKVEANTLKYDTRYKTERSLK